MKEQKVIITNKQSDINDWIGRGWVIVSITAGHVASVNINVLQKDDAAIHGEFCFLLEKGL